MSELSEGFEREVLGSLREIRGTIRAVMLVVGGLLLLWIAVAVASVAYSFLSDGGVNSGSGTDVHARLRQSATLSNRTESGQDVSATVLSMTWSQGPVLDMRVTGTDPQRLATAPWTFAPEDGQVLALTTQGTLDRLSVHLDGSLPGGSKVRFVYFDPDNSHGDLYFDVEN